MNIEYAVKKVETRARYMLRKVADTLSAVSPKRNLTLSETETPTRIGILLQWGIGDAVLALPLLQGLHDAYPGASIEVIGKPWLAELFAGEAWFNRMNVLVPPWTKYQDKYLIWQRDWRHFARQLQVLQQTRFDLLIGLRLDPREPLQMRLLNAKETAGFACAGGRHWITRDLGLSIEKYYNGHRSQVSTHALEALTGLRYSSIPSFQINEAPRSKTLDSLRQAGYKGGIILAIHDGAGHPIRRWGTDKFNAVLRTLPADLGLAVIIDDGFADNKELGIHVPNTVPYVVWQSSLADLKSLLSVCNLLLCCDSGVMHMGVASGCRVLAIFGPQLIRWFGPCGKGDDVVIVEPMPCRPCSDNCIYSSPVCMERLSVKEVSDALHRMCSLEKFMPDFEGFGC